MTGERAVTPSRPLAAQAHALRAAALLIEHAGITGLLVEVDGTAFITIRVPDQLGSPAARAALVTALASAAGAGRTVRSIALGCPDRYRITGYRQAAGHPVTITTTGAQTQ